MEPPSAYQQIGEALRTNPYSPYLLCVTFGEFQRGSGGRGLRTSRASQAVLPARPVTALAHRLFDHLSFPKLESTACSSASLAKRNASCAFSSRCRASSASILAASTVRTQSATNSRTPSIVFWAGSSIASSFRLNGRVLSVGLSSYFRIGTNTTWPEFDAPFRPFGPLDKGLNVCREVRFAGSASIDVANLPSPIVANVAAAPPLTLPSPAPAAIPQPHAPAAVSAAPATASVPPAAAVSATAPRSQIAVLVEQGLNANHWVTADLDRTIPSEIRDNIVALREDLQDE